MHLIPGCNSVSRFSHIGKVKTFQTLKIDELTDMIDFGKFPSLFLENPFVATSIQYVYYVNAEAAIQRCSYKKVF